MKKTILILTIIVMFVSILSQAIAISSSPILFREANIVSNTFPKEMKPGETKYVVVRIQNTGRAIWETRTGFNLGVKKTEWYDNPKFIVPWTINTQGKIYKNGISTYIIKITAPKKEGEYTISYQMKQQIRYINSGQPIWFGEIGEEKIIVQDEKPNLVVTDLKVVIGDDLKPGDLITFSATYENKGSSSTILQGEHAFIILNPAGGHSASSGANIALMPGESRTVSLVFPVYIVGKYDLTFKVDPSDLIFESNEDDNEQTIEFTIKPFE